MGSACFVANKRAWSIILKYVFLFLQFLLYMQKRFSEKGIPSTIPELPLDQVQEMVKKQQALEIGSQDTETIPLQE